MLPNYHSDRKTTVVAHLQLMKWSSLYAMYRYLPMNNGHKIFKLNFFFFFFLFCKVYYIYICFSTEDLTATYADLQDVYVQPELAVL